MRFSLPSLFTFTTILSGAIVLVARSAPVDDLALLDSTQDISLLPVDRVELEKRWKKHSQKKHGQKKYSQKKHSQKKHGQKKKPVKKHSQKKVAKKGKKPSQAKKYKRPYWITTKRHTTKRRTTRRYTTKKHTSKKYTTQRHTTQSPKTTRPLPTTPVTPPPEPTQNPGGQVFSGDGTYYTPALGSCGTDNTEQELVAALNGAQMQNPPNPNLNPICGRYATAKGPKGSVRVKIVDTCGPCRYGDLDLSPAAFGRIGNFDDGRIKITWTWD